MAKRSPDVELHPKLLTEADHRGQVKQHLQCSYVQMTFGNGGYHWGTEEVRLSGEAMSAAQAGPWRTGTVIW